MIDAKDHRRFAEGKLREMEAEKELKAMAKPLLAQEPTAMETGNDQLDKTMRAVEALKKATKEHLEIVKENGMTQVNPDARAIHQAEFFFTKGRLHAFEEVQKIPAEVILESKTFTPTAKA